MKVIVLDREGVEEIIAHFIAYGYTDFIVYTNVDKSYYELNGIDVIQIVGFGLESNGDKLTKIKGSLKERFFLVYSSEITDFVINEIEIYHKQKQGLTTIVEANKRLIGILAEPEIFDYIESTYSFEREVLLRVGQDGELEIYK